MSIKNFALRLSNEQYDQVVEFSDRVGISRNACINMCVYKFFVDLEKQQRKKSRHNKDNKERSTIVSK